MPTDEHEASFYPKGQIGEYNLEVRVRICTKAVTDDGVGLCPSDSMEVQVGHFHLARADDNCLAKSHEVSHSMFPPWAWFVLTAL